MGEHPTLQTQKNLHEMFSKNGVWEVVEVGVLFFLFREPEGSLPDRVNAVLPTLRGRICFDVRVGISGRGVTKSPHIPKHFLRCVEYIGTVLHLYVPNGSKEQV